MFDGNPDDPFGAGHGREPYRDATQHDIIERWNRNDLHLWETLRGRTDMAFGACIPGEDRARWQFPMGNLTVGELLDFFRDHHASPPSNLWGMWWYEPPAPPRAFIIIDDPNLAEAFAAHFDIPLPFRTMGEPTSDEAKGPYRGEAPAPSADWPDDDDDD
jgi:hypothetical protein